MIFIDSHSHLYLKEFSEDLPQVIERAKQAGVGSVLLPNIDSSTIKDMLDVCAAYKEYCYPMIGLHPTSVDSSYEQELSLVEKYLETSGEFIAVGEVGLDLYWDKTYFKEQIKAFERQISLALEYGLPLVIHSRDAFEYIYEVLLPYKEKPLKGIFHSFAGNIDEARKLMEFEGFMLGINGVVTYKNSSLPETLRYIPIDRIVIETDAPYLTPVPYRGKRNESSYLKYTLLKIAEIYGTMPEQLARVTLTNTLKVFERLKLANGDFKVY